MTPSSKVPATSRPRPLLLAGLVPLTYRPTLFYDLRSAPLNGFYLGVLSLLPWMLKHTLNGSDWEVAVLSAAPSVSHLFDIYWAHLCEKRRKMPFVLWPGIVSRLMIVLAGLAVDSVMLVVCGSLCYLVGSMATPAVNSIWRTNYPGTHRYQVVGTVMAVMNLAMVLTAFLAGLLLLGFENDWLFRVVLVTGAAVGVLGVVTFSRIKVRGERAQSAGGPSARPRFSPFRDLGLLRRNPKFGKYMLLQFVSGFSNIMTIPVLISLLKFQQAGWLSVALVLGVAPNVVNAVTMPFWGRLLQRFNPMQARAYFNWVWAAGFVGIALSGNQVAWVVVARMAMGLAMGATTLLWSLQQMYFARKEDVPKYMGVHCTLTGIRGLIAPFVGVWLMQSVFHGDPHWVFYLAALGLVSSGFLAFRMAGREKRETDHMGHVDGGGFVDYTGRAET